MQCSVYPPVFLDLTPIYIQFYTEIILLGISEVGVQLEGLVEYELLHLVLRERVLLEVEGEGVRADGFVGHVVQPLQVWVLQGLLNCMTTRAISVRHQATDFYFRTWPAIYFPATVLKRMQESSL